MFSKKSQLSPRTAGAAAVAARPSQSPIPSFLLNPYVGVGGAAALLLASFAGMVALGDPTAGAPSVRVALGEASPSGLGAFADPFDPGSGGEFGPGAIEMMPLANYGEMASGAGGEAVITFANGEQRRIPTGRVSLPPAPIAGLSQPGPGGPLPVIAADGRTPAQAYARPFAPNGKPRVAIVIGGLGLDPVVTREAIEQLPPEVTLSFALAETAGLQSWIDQARAYGHEVMLEVPMEPRAFPQDDPGPGALMANLPPDETLRRLDAFLSKATGYFGVMNYMGSKFLNSAGGSEALATGLRRRGLAFIDDGTGAQRVAGVPRATADKVIDDQVGIDIINARLAEVEQAARNRGQALGSGFAYRVTVAQVAAWARTLDQKGLQLAPASAVTVRR